MGICDLHSFLQLHLKGWIRVRIWIWIIYGLQVRYLKNTEKCVQILYSVIIIYIKNIFYYL